MRKISILFVVLAMLTLTNTRALAQKQSEPKELAKELVGVWKFEAMEVKLLKPEEQLSGEEEYMYGMTKSMVPMLSQNLSNMSYTFTPDGIYKTITNTLYGKPVERNGTWKVEKSTLTLTPNTPSQDDPIQILEASLKDQHLSLTEKRQGEQKAFLVFLKFIR